MRATIAEKTGFDCKRPSHDDSKVARKGIMAQQRNGSLLLSGPRIRFDAFELDAEKGQLHRNGLPVALSPQLLTVLVMLAERPGEVVTRKEIKEALWPGESHGDFDSRLNFAVKKLREALGDDAERPRHLQTVRNKGYRFIAPVRESQPLSSVPYHPVDRSDCDHGGSLARPLRETIIERGRLQLGIDGPFLVLLTFVVIAVATTAVLALREHMVSSAAFSNMGIKPLDAAAEAGPKISSVSPILPQARQKIIITGRGFGLHVPHARTDSPYIAIRDKTADWAAGRIIPQNYDDVMVDVESWTDTEIAISGFSGDYGRNGWKLFPGDGLEVAVWNPQSGAGPALYNIRVSAKTP